VTFQVKVRDTGSATPTINPGGTVAFIDTTAGTVLGYATLTLKSTGVTIATFTTSTLGLGTHVIQAKYSGNGTFKQSSSPVLSQQVKPVPTRTSSIGLTESLSTSVHGQDVSFTATVTDTGGVPGITPTGTVTLRDTTTGAVLGSVSLSPVSSGVGRAILTIATLDVGSHDVVAEYDGDTDFAAGSPSSAVTQVVTEASTTTTLTSSDSQSKFGQSVTLKATVKAVAPGGGVPTGSVTFTDTTTGIVLGTVALDATGVANLASSTLSIGTHAIKAEYDGSDVNFGASVGTGTQTVVQSQTKAKLSRSTSNANESLTLVATIVPVAPAGGVPTGSVTFKIDGVDRGTVVISNGQAVLILPSGLSVGSHTIKVIYSGDPNYQGVAKAFTYNFVVGRGT
jgi:hypothetical protein